MFERADRDLLSPTTIHRRSGWSASLSVLPTTHRERERVLAEWQSTTLIDR